MDGPPPPAIRQENFNAMIPSAFHSHAEPPPMSDLLRSFYGALGVEKFRGEIWEDSPDVTMGRGYANDGKPFDIASANYLTEPFRVYRALRVGKFVILAAVQTLKTYFLERTASYEMEHDPGDMTVYLCDAEDAIDHAKGRLLEMLKSRPGIADQIYEAERNRRHDITTRDFLLPAMTFRVRPLNDSATNRVTLRYIKVSDAFLAKSSGQIDKAMKRLTQHQEDGKALIESQGCEAGDDFDRHWRSTDMRLLHVRCPFCYESQPFEWQRYRGDDFKPTPCKLSSSYNDAAALPSEPPKPGTYSGMQKGCANTDGQIDEAAVLANTFYECFHCGSHWPDRPSIRAAIDASSHYLATNPKALPRNIGFSWPAWINQRLPWGGIMLEYLVAKRFDREFGNRTPLEDWWKQRAARIWQPDLAEDAVRIETGLDYDPQTLWPNEWRRIGIVDVQLHASHFWVSFDAIARDGESRQLFFGCFTSFDDIDKKAAELKIPPNRIFIDYGHESDLVKKECLRRGLWLAGRGRRAGSWYGWNMLTSSRWDKFKRSITHTDGRKSYYFDIISDGEKYSENIAGQRREVFRFNFSALHCGDMFRRHRDGIGAPRSQFLLEGVGAEKNELSHAAQIQSRYRAVVIDEKTGLKKPR